MTEETLPAESTYEPPAVALLGKLDEITGGDRFSPDDGTFDGTG